MAMKIGDVKVGTEYGATDGSKRTYSDTLPRRVEVLEVVSVPEEYWVGSGFGSERASRNVRRVKVKFLDEPTGSGFRFPVAAAPKDSTSLLEARFLACPWKDLRADVAARIRNEQVKADTKASIESRLKALLPDRVWKAHRPYALVNVNGGKGVAQVRLEGEVLTTILDLAEKGAAL